MASSAGTSQGLRGNTASALSIALPRPSTASPGAALALACHVTMVDAGFKVHEETISAKLKRRSTYQPNAGWQQESGCEWRFTYVRQGKALPITLTISLHGSSGRVLAHAVEGDFDNPSHACVMGLQLDRYINSNEMISGGDWLHVLSNEQALVSLMTEHIINPIISFQDTNIRQDKRLSARMQQLMESSNPWLLTSTGVVVAILVVTAATLALRGRRVG